MADPATEIEELKKRHDLLWKNIEYSVQRMDILTITVCGAGIYTCFELLKFIQVADQWKFPFAKYSCEEIKCAGVFFLFGIILNFVGQVLSYHANYTALNHTLCEIEVVRNTIAKNPHSTRWSKLYDKFSRIVTKMSLAAMFIGLIILVLVLVNFF